MSDILPSAAFLELLLAPVASMGPVRVERGGIRYALHPGTSGSWEVETPVALDPCPECGHATVHHDKDGCKACDCKWTPGAPK